MKKLFQYSAIAVSLLFFSACDNGFDELNTNETSPISINPAFLLNNAIINTSFTTGTAIYEMGIVQQLISPNSGVLTGANYNQDNRNATQTMWQRYYQSVIRNTRVVISEAGQLPGRNNLIQMARIWQAYAFMVMTDTYGDVPYSDAGKGFSDQVFLPKYDAQQAIYTDIIRELTEATAALDGAQAIETADVMYAGNVDQWRKLGYSLLLRAGMRLSKIDQGTAQQTVQKAFQGGVITANTDNCVIRHDNNYQNANGAMLNSTEANNFYLAEPFVKFLKDNNDPRLKAIAVRYVGAKSGPEQKGDIASTDPADQIGMPMGNDNSTIAMVAANLGLASFYDFTQADRTRVVSVAAPMFLVTAAQNQLLLAEAANRGWINGNAETLYNAGVRAHMEQMAAYSANSAVASSDIDAYLSANPFIAGKALEQINTQYWVASFLNGPEAFANFRRSGFPQLAPNPFPGKDIKGDFIHRLTYPNSEISVNNDNLKAAVARMGPDDLDTKVWWDK
ncbi:MAG TPA: SusD/RagB family nutrient-binding outer membrane lipoprotein [Flavilitoribacter sp.]|nr:SusD/RagB family nutrient-binding outer membrane lipoprotein [Flavilitoribacter sp.]HMQ90202.1 SusD/RagB family nutrient-binding outer membrane lipoprotein [Flavilitoribacter sp.]